MRIDSDFRHSTWFLVVTDSESCRVSNRSIKDLRLPLDQMAVESRRGESNPTSGSMAISPEVVLLWRSNSYRFRDTEATQLAEYFGLTVCPPMPGETLPIPSVPVAANSDGTL